MQDTKSIIITFILLIGSVLFFGLSNVDKTIQDMLYDIQTQQWILSKSTQPYHFIFYSGLKKLLIFISILLLFMLIFFSKKKMVIAYKKGLYIILLSLIFVTTISVEIKKHSNMPCPKHHIHYGGNYPDIAVWETYKQPHDSLQHTKCWPAGHASAGFSFLSLFFLFKQKRNRYIGLVFGLILGWSMGTYKILIGDHFFSHTFITMLLAWLIILIINKTVNYKMSLKTIA